MNKERVGTFTLEEEGGYRDVAMLQDCDSGVEEICRQCGWSTSLKEIVRPSTARETPAVAKNITSSKKQPSVHVDKHYHHKY